MKKTAFTIALTGALMMSVAAFGGPTKPLNAGKDGFKSNAGGGNGTEDVSLGTSTTESTTTSTYTYDQATGDPVVVSTTTVAETEIGREVTSGPVLVSTSGKSSNTKVVYTVTYEVVTTTDTETTTTYETREVTEVFKTTTTTEDMADVDPGRSQEVNQAPEGQPEDIVTVETEALGASEEVIGTFEETETTSASETDTTTLLDEVVCNPGNHMCDGDGVIPQ